MQFLVKNETSRPKALRSAVKGEMIIVPANSEGVYDLAESGHPTVPGLSIGSPAVAPAKAPAKAPAAPAKAPAKAAAAQPAAPAEGASAEDLAGPAPWQKGLAG